MKISMLFVLLFVGSLLYSDLLSQQKLMKGVNSRCIEKMMMPQMINSSMHFLIYLLSSLSFRSQYLG